MSYFDRYLVKPGSLKNEVVDGQVIGFTFQVHIGAYHGVFLSLVRGYYIEVDGIEYTLDRQKFEINGKPPRDWDEIAKAVWEHWEYHDYATIHVEKRGGLTPGEHNLKIIQGLLSAYGWQATDEEYAKNCPPPKEMVGMFGSRHPIYSFDMVVE